MSEGNDKLELGINIPAADLAKLERMDKALDKLGRTTTTMATSLKSHAKSSQEFLKAFSASNSAESITKAFQAANASQLADMKSHMAAMTSTMKSGMESLTEAMDTYTGNASGTRRRKASDELKRVLAKDMELNVKYAADTNAALQQINAKGTSTMLANLQKRSESIRRILESEHPKAEQIAKKRYGSDFVGTVQRGLESEIEVLAKHGETRLALIGAMANKEAEAIRLAAEKVKLAMKAANIGTTGQMLAGNEVVGSYTPYNALRSSPLKPPTNIGTTGQRLAGNEVVGSYTPYNALRSAVIKPAAPPPLLNLGTHAQEVEGMVKGFDRLTLSGNNLHSSVRGLASGFGALWLTWGNTLPLLAGAAISFSLAGAVKSGKEFETTLFNISEVAGTSAADMATLRDRLLEIGNKGMYGPLEAAKGLEVLSLAGLNATDALAALEPTMRFASAGGVDMKKAAEVTVAVGQAYGFTAKQYETLQDIITRTASTTIASVSDMAEAFKTASVVAQHFNLSLADTAEGLGALAQIGITGSAAGTSYRNFYTEITKSSGHVADALKALRVNIRQVGGEADGELKPTIEIFRELTLATINKTKASQDSYFANLSNERSAKTFAAAQAKALETVKGMAGGHLEEAAALEAKGKKAEAAAIRIKAVNAAFDQMSAKSKADTEDAAGTNFIIAAEKRLTSQGFMDALKASLETGLVGAFAVASDSLMVFANNLHQTFSSPEFQKALADLVKGTVDLGMALVDATKYLWEHKEAVAGVAAAYVLFGTQALAFVAAGFVVAKAAVLAFATEVSVGSVAVTALRNSVLSVALAAEITTGALTATSALVTGGLVVGIAALTLGVIAATAAVAALAVKWIFSGESARESLEKQDAALLKGLKESSAALRAKADLFNANVVSELAASEDLLKARKSGLTSAQAADKAYAETAVRRVEEYYRQMAAVEQLTALKAESYYIDNQMYSPEMARSVAQAEMESRLVKIEKDKHQEVYKTIQQLARLREVKSQIAKMDLEESKTKRRGIQGSEEDIFNPRAAKGRADPKIALDSPLDNTLAELSKRYSTELSLLDKKETDVLAILKAQRDAELITEGEHFAKLLGLTQEFSDKKAAMLDSTKDLYSKSYDQHVADIGAAFRKWLSSNQGASQEEVDKAFHSMSAKIANAKNTADSFFEKLSADRAKNAGAAFKLVEVEIIKTNKALFELKKTSKEFWEAQDRTQDKAAAAAALDESLRYADPAYAAGVKAAANAQEGLTDQYNKLVIELQRVQESMDAVTASQMASGVPTEEASKMVASYTAHILKLREEMGKLRGEQGEGIKERAAATAKTLVTNSEREKLASSLSDAVISGLSAGGDESAKNLKKVLEDELSKPIKVNLQAMFSSLLGGSSATGASLGGPGSTILNNLSNMYDTLTGGLNAGVGAGKFLMEKSGGISSALGLGDGANQLLGEFGAGMMNTATMQSATMAAQAGGAQLAGVIAGSVLNGVSGYGISKALSGGFKIDGLNIDAIAGIASMIPGIGPVAGVIGGLVNRAFGHGETQVREQGTRGTFSSAGFSGQNYANMHQQGGWFTSDRNWTETSAIDEAITKRWTVAFEGVKAAAAASAKAMGLSADAITNYSKSIDIAAGATSDTVLAVFSGMADELALKLVPNIAGFAVEGEAARDTLARMATGLTVVNTWLTATRTALYAVSVSGAVAAAELIKAHGGLDKFASVSQAFYDTYYTAGEKVADSQLKMRKALALLGYALPSTTMGFRSLVEGLDLNTEAGRNAHAVLLSLAPEFASTTEAVKTVAEEVTKAATAAAEALLKAVTGSQSGVVASLGMVTSGLNLLSSTATNPTVSSLAAATAASAAMSNELLFMNSIMGNSASSVLAFDAKVRPLNDTLTVAQTASYALQQQIYALAISADTSQINFTKLSTAMASVDTETFMITITKVFEDLAGRVSKVMGDIASERASVREAAISILAPQSLSKTQIESRIATIQSGAPSNSGVVNTAANFASLSNQLSAANSRVAAAQATATTAQNNVSRYNVATQNYNSAYSDYSSKYATAASAQTVVNSTPSMAMRDTGPWYNRSSEAYTPDNYIAAVDALNAAKAALQASESKMYTAQATRFGIMTELGGNGSSQLISSKVDLNVETAYRDALQEQVLAAQAVAKAAVLAYQKAMQDFVNSAATSVTQLSKLKDETVKYYEAQKALAGLLANSAASIRETIRSYKFSQMTDMQKAEDLKSQFAQATLMAQSATGDGLVAASDKVNSLINPLIEALQSTGQESLIGKVLADSESIAALVDKNILAMGDYKAESLALLDLIDNKLLALGASTGTAQDVIAAAVAAGADKTSNGLRAVIAAILGQSVPAFATGGFHEGGLRLVGENGPELEATGPSRIYNAAQTQSLLTGTGPDNTARLEALIAQQAEIMRQQSRQLENMSYELRAIAGNTGYTSAVLKKVTQGGESLQTTEVAA